MTMQKVNKQFQSQARYPLICAAVKRIYETDEGQKVQDCHPALTHPTASAINSAVITNNGICQRSVSYLNGRFDKRVYQWK